MADAAPDIIPLHGEFRDAAGQPIADGRIRFVLNKMPAASACSIAFDCEQRTDAGGRFRIDVGPSRWQGQAPVMPLDAFCHVIIVGPAGELGWFADFVASRMDETIVIQAAAPSTVSGRLLDDAGQPIVGAQVGPELYTVPAAKPGETLDPSAPGDRVSFRVVETYGDMSLDPRDRNWGPTVRRPLAITDADGRYTLPGLPTDLCACLAALHPDYATTRIPLAGIADTTEATVMTRAATVTIRVAPPPGESLAGARFNLAGSRDGIANTYFDILTLGEDNHLVFSQLPPGDYELRLVRGRGSRLAMPVLAIPALPAGDSRSHTVGPTPGTILHGTVTSRFMRQPRWHAAITLYDADRHPRAGSTVQTAYTDPAGRFRFDFAVTPGPLTVELTYHGKRLVREITVSGDPEQQLDLRI